MGALKAIVSACVLLQSIAAAADPVDQWSSEIGEASLRFRLPPEWIKTVMRLESGGRSKIHGQHVVSSAGAMGLMQLMPSTWSDMQALLGLGPDPFNPHDNILAGAAYLRKMYERFGFPGMFAAYDAGPGRYAEFISRGRRLPRETRSYLAAASRGSENLPQALQPDALFALVRERRNQAHKGRTASRRGARVIFARPSNASISLIFVSDK